MEHDDGLEVLMGRVPRETPLLDAIRAELARLFTELGTDPKRARMSPGTHRAISDDCLGEADTHHPTARALAVATFNPATGTEVEFVIDPLLADGTLIFDGIYPLRMCLAEG